MRVEILCTGDEILTGKTVNTNYSHIARRLSDVGLDVHWGTTVGDDRATLLAAFRQAGERADAVIVNGGLGPTVDDLSQEIAAEACGVKLVLSEHWMERMTQSYARRGRVMPANNKKQAMLPEGAEFIDNPIGTACGFAVTIGKARFLFTPGVPREMRRMLDEQVIPRLLKLGGITGVTKLKRFHSFGIGETFTSGAIASRLAPLLGADAVFRRGVIAAGVAADALRAESGTSHALVVLMQLDDGPDRPDFGATITVQIADAGGTVQRVARLVGGRDWVRIGAAELGLDCLRRHLLGLPVDERIDFERR